MLMSHNKERGIMQLLAQQKNCKGTKTAKYARF